MMKRSTILTLAFATLVGQWLNASEHKGGLSVQHAWKPCAIRIPLVKILFSWIPQVVRPSSMAAIVGESVDIVPIEKSIKEAEPSVQKSIQKAGINRVTYSKAEKLVGEMKKIFSLSHFKEHWVAGLSAIWNKKKMPEKWGRARPSAVSTSVQLNNGGREIAVGAGVSFDSTIWPQAWKQYRPVETSANISGAVSTCSGVGCYSTSDFDYPSVKQAKVLLGVKWDKDTLLPEAQISMTSAQSSWGAKFLLYFRQIMNLPINSNVWIELKNKSPYFGFCLNNDVIKAIPGTIKEIPLIKKSEDSKN